MKRKKKNRPTLVNAAEGVVYECYKERGFEDMWLFMTEFLGVQEWVVASRPAKSWLIRAEL